MPIENAHDFVLDETDFIEYAFAEHAERSDDKRPVMLVRHFTDEQHREFMRIMRRGEKAKGDQLIDFQIDVMKLGWAGWRNVKDKDSEDVEFDKEEKTGQPTTKQINRLKINQRSELCYIIANQEAALTETQRKNLQLSQQSDAEETSS